MNNDFDIINYNDNCFYDDDFLTKLPGSLTNEEIIKYFNMYRNGDLEAREKIINHNLYLVLNRISKRFSSKEYDKKDLFSVGVIGLIKAIDSFDINDENDFITYTNNFIENEILDLIANFENKNESSFDSVVGVDEDGEDLFLVDDLEDEKEDFSILIEDKEIYSKLKILVDKLVGRDKVVIEMYFGFYDGKCYSKQEIANKYNLTTTSIYAIIKDNLKRLKTAIENNDMGSEFEELGKKGFKDRTIYQYIGKYPEDKVNEAIDKLIDEEKDIIKMYFGFYDGKRYSLKEIAEKYNSYATNISKIIESILEKIEDIINYNNVDEGIYKYFNNYTKEEIDTVIAKLSKKNIEMLKQKYGDDFKHPVEISNVDIKVRGKIINVILPKMKKMLGENVSKNRRALISKNVKSLYEILNEYSREEIDEKINKLSYDEQNVLNSVYVNGYDKEDKIWAFEDIWSRFETLIQKIKKELCENFDYVLMFSKEKNSDGRKSKSIYQILNMYSKDDINYAIERLSFEDTEIIRLKYGTPGRCLNVAGNDRFFHVVIPRIEKIINNKNIDEDEKKYQKDVRNIYNAFDDFTKEEINEVIDNLSESDKELLRLRYGNDLENPVTSCDFDTNAISRFYQTLIPKIRRLLMVKRNGIDIKDNKTIEKPNPNSRKIKSIYDYFPKYKKEQIDLVLDKLPEEDIKILKIRYGEDIRGSYSSGEPNSVNDRIFAKTLIPKIKKFLDDDSKLEDYTGDLRNSKDFKNIYELLSDYTKEEINIVIERLQPEYKEVINLRYGENLEKPVTSKDWNKKSSSKFYYTVIPKIKKMLIKNRENNNVVEDSLDNSLIDNEDIEVTDIILDKDETEEVDINLDNIEESEILDVEESKNIENNVSIDEYIKLSGFIKRLNIFDSLSKEMVVISLKFGFIDNKYYSNESIANFLGISEEEVINIVKNSLELYKERINNLFDIFSDVLLDDKGFERKIK